MGFLKKFLGIDKFEEETIKKFEQVDNALKTSWNWVNYLHELEQDNKSKIKQLIKENEQLKELVKTNRLQNYNDVKVPEPNSLNTIQKQEIKHKIINKEAIKVKEGIKEKVKSGVEFKKIDISGIGQKEAYIIQLLYQLACFDQSSSIRTSKIHSNLPYKISSRGLRKKLYKLDSQGIVSSIVMGNTRKWFLNMDKMTKLKELISIKN